VPKPNHKREDENTKCLSQNFLSPSIVQLQTKEGIKTPHMIIESKIRVICLQPPIRLKLNFAYKVINRFPLLLKNYSIHVTLNNPNTREPNQVKGIGYIFRKATQRSKL